MAMQAFKKAAAGAGDDGKIGCTYLLNNEDRHFPFSLHILNEHLFLREEQKECPKVISYRLDNLYVVTNESFLPRKRLSKKDKTFFSAKVVTGSGIHRRLCFQSFEEMQNIVEIIVRKQGFINRLD
mmetsp:Transcript_31280/g.36699  ORF Transcript_31280/g.36699 Transcript_31280/m.36699 type:complete len:126 (-) Transcript_31280:124-501(-)